MPSIEYAKLLSKQCIRSKTYGGSVRCLRESIFGGCTYDSGGGLPAGRWSL